MNIKNKINKFAIYVLCCTFGLLTVSCDGFLDRPPADQYDHEEFWQNEAQARAFVMQIYPIMFPGYGTGNVAPTTFYFDTGNDDFMSGTNQGNFGQGTIPVADGRWNFVNIRRANYIIENAHRIADLDEAGRLHWEGVGRFYRAFLYSNMVFTFGGVPWIDRVPVLSDRQEDREFMFQDRQSRQFIVARIMEDFDFARRHVRRNDGLLQINSYVVAAMAARQLLREGTFLRYHNIDDAKAIEVLQMAREMAEFVMSGPFQISNDYHALFNSDCLAGNPEIIMFRRYDEERGSITHNMLFATTVWSVMGSSRSFAESFLMANGLPVLVYDENWHPETSEEFFANRDPRLSMILRPVYRVHTEPPYLYRGFVAHANSGFSPNKYAADDRFVATEPAFMGGRGITDAPVLRLGEVLINYAEIMYELGELNQAVLDNSINRLRGRRGVEMPRLVLVGDMPSVGGVIYDDPMRLRLNPNNDVSPILWEIRRERRVELGHEGFRTADLRRWRKLCYMMNSTNPGIRTGVYIRFADFNPNAGGVPSINDAIRIISSDNIVYHVGGERARWNAWLALPADEREKNPFEPSPVTSGWILGNWGDQRTVYPGPRDYIAPIPQGQIDFYARNGFTLSQNPEWID